MARLRRQCRPAAQGVARWFRKLNGKWYQFTLVTEGWWRVPETGTVHVWRQISNGDWYVTSTYHVDVKPGACGCCETYRKAHGRSPCIACGHYTA